MVGGLSRSLIRVAAEAAVNARKTAEVWGSDYANF